MRNLMFLGENLSRILCCSERLTLLWVTDISPKFLSHKCMNTRFYEHNFHSVVAYLWRRTFHLLDALMSEVIGIFSFILNTPTRLFFLHIRCDYLFMLLLLLLPLPLTLKNVLIYSNYQRIFFNADWLVLV